MAATRTVDDLDGLMTTGATRAVPITLRVSPESAAKLRAAAEATQLPQGFVFMWAMRGLDVDGLDQAARLVRAELKGGDDD